jgi:hypothetical protein
VGDFERGQLYTTDVMRFAKSMSNAAQMLIGQSCSENTINFDYDAAVTGYENAGAPADNSCDIFNAKGAGLTWKIPPANLSTSAYMITSANTVLGAGCDAGTSTCTDLILILPGISLATCIQINNTLKVTNPSNAPPVDTNNNVNTTTKFTGSYTYAQTISDSGSVLSGKDAACIQTAAGLYAFYYVLLKR